MQRIATTQELVDELRSLLAYCEAPNPSRTLLANALLGVATRLGSSGFKPGRRVRVKPSHGFSKWHGDEGVVEKLIPINKAYVELEREGRQILDLNDLELI